jgi:hypothetical protein
MLMSPPTEIAPIQTGRKQSMTKKISFAADSSLNLPQSEKLAKEFTTV